MVFQDTGTGVDSRAGGDNVVDEQDAGAIERWAIVRERIGDVAAAFAHGSADLAGGFHGAQKASRWRLQPKGCEQLRGLVEPALALARTMEWHGHGVLEGQAGDGAAHVICHFRGGGSDTSVLRTMHSAARRTGHFERSGHRLDGLHIEAARAVVGGVPFGAAACAAALSRRWRAPIATGLAEEHAEAAAARAARGVQEIGGAREQGAEMHCEDCRLPIDDCRLKCRVVLYNVVVAVTVLLFAAMAERAGLRSVLVDYVAGDTVADIRERVLAERPGLSEFVPTLLYALDEEYARESDSVPDGATVAFIPPVSGG